ncbi:MAG: class IV adenylate cyclase [Anaerohalosphaeraceae bacterium]
MNHLNIEMKAHCRHPERVRRVLQEAGAVFRGTDEQTDVYFRVPKGRLKLRQGTIENALIFYERPDEAGPKRSDVFLYPAADSGLLREVLERALGILAVVRKRREIYFLGNIKFHLDRVEGLGDFAEIEVMDTQGSGDCEGLRRQCEEFMKRFGIEREDLLECSYSDMILEKGR